MSVKKIIESFNNVLNEHYEDNISPEAKEILEQIAQDVLGFTLVQQDSDGKDFHDVSVWTLEEAMYRAYAKGFTMGLKQAARNNEN